MKELNAQELDYIYSILSEKLEKFICDGIFGDEDEIADLHVCLAKLITMEATARKNQRPVD